MDSSQDWNRWRGAQQNAMENIVKVLEHNNTLIVTTNKRLTKIENELWYIKGKSAAYGTLAALVLFILENIFGGI